LLRSPVLPFVEIKIADFHFVFGLKRIEGVLFGLLGLVLFRWSLLLRGRLLLLLGWFLLSRHAGDEAQESQTKPA
jgi:hypothetical protein